MSGLLGQDLVAQLRSGVEFARLRLRARFREAIERLPTGPTGEQTVARLVPKAAAARAGCVARRRRRGRAVHGGAP